MINNTAVLYHTISVIIIKCVNSELKVTHSMPKKNILTYYIPKGILGKKSCVSLTILTLFFSVFYANKFKKMLKKYF